MNASGDNIYVVAEACEIVHIMPLNHQRLELAFSTFFNNM